MLTTEYIIHNNYKKIWIPRAFYFLLALCIIKWDFFFVLYLFLNQYFKKSNLWKTLYILILKGIELEKKIANTTITFRVSFFKSSFIYILYTLEVLNICIMYNEEIRETQYIYFVWWSKIDIKINLILIKVWVININCYFIYIFSCKNHSTLINKKKQLVWLWEWKKRSFCLFLVFW